MFLFLLSNPIKKIIQPNPKTNRTFVPQATT